MQATIPLSEARAHLADTLRRVEQQDEPAFISRRGEPVAVLLSLAQYERLCSGANNGFAGRLAAWRAAHADELQAEDDSDFCAGVRDASPGRDFAW